jgi:hypothetical protein
MSPREIAKKIKSWILDLAGLAVDVVTSLGRLLQRGWMGLRPHLGRLWTWASPGFAALWTRLASIGRRLTGGARAGLPRLKRPLLLSLRIGLIAAVIGTITLGVGRAFVRHTPVGQIAVRQIEWGGAGVIERDHGPGLHRQFAGRDGWHLLRAGSHLVSFASEVDGGTHPPLEVATVEGEACQVSALVPYRIVPGRGWRLVAEGLRADYPSRAVAICRRVLLEELGALSASECADPEARSTVERAAYDRLTEELGATHLEPLDVRIGSVYFNATYEKKMLEKQLAAQGQLTQASMVLRKEQERRNEQELRKLQDAEAALIHQYLLQQEVLLDAHEQKVHGLVTEAEHYGAQVLSASQVEVLQLKNEGELALIAAEDLRETLFDKALESTGGRLHVAREAAENLRFGTVTLNSNDPRVPSVLDLDELVSLLLGNGE